MSDREEFLVRVLLHQLIEHTHLGADQELLAVRCGCVINDLGRTSDEVRQCQRVTCTLRMCQNKCVRMQLLCLLHIFTVNTLMYMAESIIKDEVLLRKLTCHETTKILIRDKEDIFIRKILHDLQCI